MLIRIGYDDLKIVLRDSGSLLKWSGIVFLAPLILGIWFSESISILLIYALTATFSFFLGLSLKRACRTESETGLKHAFMTVVLVWLVVTAIAAIPFVLITGMTFVDSFFEVMSALTTTGLSMMKFFIDSAPKSLIFFRSLLSWIGGVGIIVLALMGILSTYTKSSKLLVAEGHQERIRPNLKNTAKEIWVVYAILTVLSIALLFFSGMDLFNAVNYAMSAISTSGMDTTSQGLVGVTDPAIIVSLGIIMLVGAISFSTHHLFIIGRKYDAYAKDIETKTLLFVLVLSMILVVPKVAVFYQNNWLALQTVFFQNTSALTGGGFSSVPAADISGWGDFVMFIMLGIMIIGGSSGSTAGGIKISRFILFCKSVYWKIMEAILPKDSFFQKNFEGRPVKDSEIKEVNQFILLYLVFILLGVLVLTFQNVDFLKALFVVISAQGNVGIDIGVVSVAMPLASKIMLIFNMWVGRLEIIPIMSAAGFLLSLKGK